jgi:hypothetical protein
MKPPVSSWISFWGARARGGSIMGDVGFARCNTVPEVLYLQVPINGRILTTRRVGRNSYANAATVGASSEALNQLGITF